MRKPDAVTAATSVKYILFAFLYVILSLLAEISVNIIALFFYIIQIADFSEKVLTFPLKRDIIYNVYVYTETKNL